ncbi:MAG: succinate dehydrogenase, cytochrome b556 subunit [Gammaproteobacteria bacterium]|nr:succinate dehydrogenase, cytochrome b556 subunit [Gammaproteobacteria bacterium]
MHNVDNRPRFLNLFAIHFPLPAITSILHRLSGLFMFALIIPALYVFDLSLQGEQGFLIVQKLMHHGFVVFLSVALVWALTQHLLAGIRFLLLDIHIGDERKKAAHSARWVNLVALLVAVYYLGYRL